MTDKQWKKSLLSSGLPLEHSVAGILKRLGLGVHVEYNYIRRNELGQDVKFSVDLCAIHRDERKGLLLSLLLECKYCARGTLWVFVPDESEAPFNQVRPSYFTGTDLFASNSVSTLSTMTLYEQEQAVLRGIQIAEHGNVAPGAVAEAVAQLRYASLEQSLEWTGYHLNNAKLFGPKDPRIPAASVCIVVTTAELRVLKPHTTLEAFEQAQRLEDLTFSAPYVFLEAPPDASFQRHATRRIREDLSEARLQEDGLLGVLEPLKAASAVTDVDDFILSHVRLSPSVFLIVQYSHLEAAVAKVLGDVERIAILDPEATRRISKRK